MNVKQKKHNIEVPISRELSERVARVSDLLSLLEIKSSDVILARTFQGAKLCQTVKITFECFVIAFGAKCRSTLECYQTLFFVLWCLTTFITSQEANFSRRFGALQVEARSERV